MFQYSFPIYNRSRQLPDFFILARFPLWAGKCVGLVFWVYDGVVEFKGFLVLRVTLPKMVEVSTFAVSTHSSHGFQSFFALPGFHFGRRYYAR